MAFISTLPQAGDRGYKVYMALSNAHQEAVDALSNNDDALLRMELKNEELTNEIQKLKKQLLVHESIKVQMAEAQTALKVVSGLAKN